jgi:hypothetical protein
LDFDGVAGHAAEGLVHVGEQRRRGDAHSLAGGDER